MSIKVQLEVSWEEMRALSQVICLAKDQLDDLEADDPIDDLDPDEKRDLLLKRLLASKHVRLAEAYVAGVKAGLFDKLQALEPGDHLREHYWPYAFEVAGKQP